MDLVELKEKSTVSREDAAAPYALSEELAANSHLVIGRDNLRFVAHVPTI